MIDALPLARSLPFSEESERAVLGGLLLEPSLIPEVLGPLAAEDFYLEKHQLLAKALADLQAGGVVPDVRTLQAHLEERGKLESAGGLAYLATLDLDLPDIGRIESYAAIVRERAIRRRMIARAGEAIRDCLDGGSAADDVAGSLHRFLGDVETLATSGAPESWRTLGERLEAYMDLLEQPPVEAGPRMGIETLEPFYTSIDRGKLALIGGRSGVGKTAMLLQMLGLDILARRPVGVISLEMTASDLMQRLLGHMIGLNGGRLRRGMGTSADYKKLVQFSRALRATGCDQHVHIDDTPGQRLPEILAKVRRLRRRKGIIACYLDFLTLVPREGKRSAHEEIDRLTYELAELAKREQISMIVLCQLNRGPAKENRPPQVADLREAGEQAAHYVFLLHRRAAEQAAQYPGEEEGDEPRLYGPRGSVVLGKHRDGREGWARTWYDGDRLQWWDLKTWEACGGHRGMLWPGENQPEQMQIGGNGE